eukprot:SAG11_NODE_134_length_15338_cov_3.876435_26_plen_43_part_00
MSHPYQRAQNLSAQEHGESPKLIKLLDPILHAVRLNLNLLPS